VCVKAAHRRVDEIDPRSLRNFQSRSKKSISFINVKVCCDTPFTYSSFTALYYVFLKQLHWIDISRITSKLLVQNCDATQ